MKFEFEGMGELASKLEKMERGAKKSESDALQEGAKIMKKSTEQHAPVRTGRLKGNIKTSDVSNGEIEVYVDSQGPAYYGHMVEFGTNKMRAKPFMGPAYNSSVKNIEKAISNSLRRSLGL